jgi:hypothetical protein
MKNCPHDGINLNLRIPGKEIWEMRRANTGTAFLVISMIGGLLSEMFAKTPLYGSMTLNMPVPEMARFTSVFLTTLVAANLMIIVAAWLSHRVYGDSWEQNYYGHGVALIPLALTSFMAYHVYYLINLGTQLPLLLSQNINSEVLRWLIVKVQPSTTHLIQQFLIWAGLAWSLVIVYRLGRGSHDRLLPAMIGAIPHAVVTVALALAVLQGIKSSFYG